jgi:UDP-N-acetylmuramoylalanine--D-glutamate ligase
MTNQQIAILGAGESGIGAALLAKQRGYGVLVSDKGTISENFRQTLDQNGIEWEQGQHSTDTINRAAEVVKSPGMPDHVPVLEELRTNGIPVISEIEFASRFTDATIIGITGTNGKSTTTELTYKLLKDGDFNVAMAGNIGHSFARKVAEATYDYYVLEISSFQLDGIERFRPHIAVLLNITPDHLDRYNNKLANYIASKFRITENQTEDDYFIYCLDDDNITQHLNTTMAPRATEVPFSYTTPVSYGAYAKDGTIIFNLKTKMEMAIESLPIQGKHNTYNSMAAGIAGKLVGLRNEAVRNSMMDFEAIEHRLEFVAKVGGIEFINDSKATNINSAWYALETMKKPVIWIAGGQDKGNDYEILKPLVDEKVKAIVCLGEDNRKLHEAFSGLKSTLLNATTAEEAVQLAYRMASKGDVALLSPACASFDLFENFRDRGEKFKNAVYAL